ncbi:MAG: DHH family phosphoesterase [Flavobacteriaceae bacterium]
MQFISELKLRLQAPKKAVIIPHKNPDGDALGSTLALMLFLKAKNWDATVISPNDYPNFLNWLPYQDQILRYKHQPKEIREKMTHADLIFTLDFNALSRCGDLKSLVERSKAERIMIDHHESPEDYAQLIYSDPTMSSTCEMVYHLIHELDPSAFTPEIANCLYTGIMTDTGSFRYPATTPTTHRAIAHLIEKGANGDRIHQKIYDSSSFSRLKLLGLTLSKMNKIEGLPVVYMTLNKEELDQCDYKKGDTEGFVNYGLSLEGILFSCIMIENESDGVVKMSFRSQGNFSVNEFARVYFNGGGHHNAAGGISDKSIDQTVATFKKALKEIEHEF